MPSIVECAYAAGIFDGEGHVQIRTQRRTPGTETLSYSLRASVGNTKYELLYWLKDRWGGSICQNNTKRPNAKPFRTWQTDANQAVLFLHDIYPATVIKQQELWLALEFWAQCKQNQPCWGRNNPRPLEISILSEGYKIALRSLTRRGYA